MKTGKGQKIESLYSWDETISRKDARNPGGFLALVMQEKGKGKEQKTMNLVQGQAF